MSNSTLSAIQTKVRRLTRSLSPAQLTDAQLNEYINTFVQFDFPEHLRLFNLRQTFQFFTEPYKDVYDPIDYGINTPLYEFNQKYITVHPPFYVAGYQATFLESREKLYGMYPKISAISQIGSGDGVTQTFIGTLPNLNPGCCLIKNNVTFNSIDVNGDALVMVDFPVNELTGSLYVPGTPPPMAVIPNNFINYVQGGYQVTFATPPAVGAVVNSQTVAVQTSRPTNVCFFDGAFIVRPVPDQAYPINMEVYARPTELLQANAATQSPELHEWWQYIAFSSAVKIFQDRMDMESVQMIMPELKKQECLINRRTIVQQTSQRVATIYTEDNNQATPFGPNSNGGF